MSKQSEAKKQQGYRQHGKACGSCIHRSFTEKADEWLFIHEKNNRCAIGGFAVKKSAVCNLWEGYGD